MLYLGLSEVEKTQMVVGGGFLKKNKVLFMLL